MKEPDGLDIRYTSLDDEKYLLEWIKQEENNKWFPMSTEKEIAISCKNWVGFSRFKCSLTATIEGKPVGLVTLFLMPYRKVAHLCMFYLIVDQNMTKKGIGTALLRNAINLAKKYFRLESLYVEVFEGAPVIKLLEKFNFKKFAEQPDFVREDGISMSRVLMEHIL